MLLLANHCLCTGNCLANGMKVKGLIAVFTAWAASVGSGHSTVIILCVDLGQQQLQLQLQLQQQ